MEVKWSKLKSERLKRTRGVSFEEIIETKIIGVKKHSSREGQRVILFEYLGYIWAVPCVITANEVFLKTLYPSRKLTRMKREGRL